MGRKEEDHFSRERDKQANIHATSTISSGQLESFRKGWDAAGARFREALSAIQDRESVQAKRYMAKDEALDDALADAARWRDMAWKMRRKLAVLVSDHTAEELERKAAVRGAMRAVEACDSMTDGCEEDHDALVRILDPVMNLIPPLCKGLITGVFANGRRLSFGCGENGRLNMIVIDDGDPRSDVPDGD